MISKPLFKLAYSLAEFDKPIGSKAYELWIWKILKILVIKSSISLPSNLNLVRVKHFDSYSSSYFHSGSQMFHLISSTFKTFFFLCQELSDSKKKKTKKRKENSR